ncbi:MAG: hypothetical protein HOP23_00975 [Methylococcaceae bacterium]|nr:hypothetical protein [Methylococcaceae bacterium]
MNAQQANVYKFYGLTSLWLVPFLKIATGKYTIELKQLFLITRIMVTLLTIGLIGYSFDRVLKLIQKPTTSD